MTAIDMEKEIKALLKEAFYLIMGDNLVKAKKVSDVNVTEAKQNCFKIVADTIEEIDEEVQTNKDLILGYFMHSGAFSDMVDKFIEEEADKEID